MQRPRAHVPVAILGAGLTGLSAGYHLGLRGVPYRLFERASGVGGHAVTVEESGFRFDRTGHLLHLRDPQMRSLALSWIGSEWLEVERRSLVWSNGVYTRYPFQANTYGLPPQVAYECLAGYLRAHFEPSPGEPRNFEEFCLRHFGEGISRHFMIPYNTRLWGVHPSEITAAWCSRFVPLPKLEDVLAGTVGLNDRELGYNTRFVYPKSGIGALADGMAKSLVGPLAPAHGIELSRAPRSIDWRRRELRFDDGIVGYEQLISTAPMQQLVRLLEDAPDAIRAAGERLRCNHLYYLDVAVNEPARNPLHWVYVPEEKYPFYRVGCYSNFSAALTPRGKSSFYVELADRNPPTLEPLLMDVYRGLTELGLISGPEAVQFARLRRLDHAYVIFDHSYYESLETLRPFLADAGIQSTGRYGGWNYSSMEDALLFGRDAAACAAQHLTSREVSAGVHHAEASS